MSKESSPIFSIIIPTFNRKNFLKKAIDTVLMQSFNDFELIVVDDGSNDDTESMVKQYDDQRIKYFFQDNHGPAHARNRGLEKARAKWIVFLDSDDWWLEGKLARTKECIDEFPEMKIFHTQEVWYRDGKLLNQKKEHRKPGGFVYKNALPLCCISISTVAIDKAVFSKVGTFDEALPACEDYDFWLRATHEFEVKLIDEYLTEKEGGRPDQLSSQWGLDQYRIKALEKMLKNGKLNDEEYQETLKVFKKKCKVFGQGARKRGRISEAEYYEKLVKGVSDK